MLRSDIEALTSHDTEIFSKRKTVLLTVKESNMGVKQLPDFEENTERVDDVGPEEFYWANREWMEKNGII